MMDNKEDIGEMIKKLQKQGIDLSVIFRPRPKKAYICEICHNTTKTKLKSISAYEWNPDVCTPTILHDEVGICEVVQCKYNIEGEVCCAFDFCTRCANSRDVLDKTFMSVKPFNYEAEEEAKRVLKSLIEKKKYHCGCKSGCRTLRCICFQNNEPCGDKCTCRGCENPLNLYYLTL